MFSGLWKTRQYRALARIDQRADFGRFAASRRSQRHNAAAPGPAGSLEPRLHSDWARHWSIDPAALALGAGLLRSARVSRPRRSTDRASPVPMSRTRTERRSQACPAVTNVPLLCDIALRKKSIKFETATRRLGATLLTRCKKWHAERLAHCRRGVVRKGLASRPLAKPVAPTREVKCQPSGSQHNS